MNTLLRPEEVAERLAVSKVTVYRLARSGELVCLHIRGQVRFRPEAVDEYLARCETQALPAEPRRPRGRPRKQWVA